LTPVKAQYNLSQDNEDLQAKNLGDLTPQNVPMPWYNQYNRDPLGQSESTGGIYKFSVANPVTDLLGSGGWLTSIDFNTYEPLLDQLPQIGFDTWRRFALTSEPLLISAAQDYAQNQTMNGTKLGVGGWNNKRDTPLLIEDVLKRIGMGSYHTMVAGAFPDLFLKASWEGEAMEIIGAEAFEQFMNFLTGLKLNQIDTVENRQKGLKEVLDKLKGLQPGG
jgi:hypothetical protein